MRSPEDRLPGPDGQRTRPTVATASLGGTITMTSVSTDGRGVAPSLSAADLLATVPQLDEIAVLHTQTLRTLPGASLGFADLAAALQWAKGQVAEGAAGVVVIQGTDTIEETAYLLDLHWDEDAPLIVTGAMRPPQLAGADGPANLLASVRVACSERSRCRGVLVVLNDEIHAASRVRKMRASGPDAFESPSFGPLGYVDEGAPVFGNTVVRSVLGRPLPDRGPRIALLETTLGDDGALLDLVAGAGFDGVVLAGFGVGHVSAAVADAVGRALESVPVVLASRAGSGSTYRHSYGFIGSESDLLARGAIAAGWLDARKARILLACLIAGGADRAQIRREFDERGAMTGAGAGPQ